MSRILKFRAWDKLNKEWAIPEQVFLCIAGYVWREADKKFDTPNDEIVIANCDYVLMQYTGLKDRLGKKIYEGDIVDYKVKGLVGEVYYEDGSFLFNHNRGTSLVYRINLPDFNSDHRSCEVIGNIYEHSHLLDK